jgi:hypothetical protein
MVLQLLGHPSFAWLRTISGRLYWGGSQDYASFLHKEKRSALVIVEIPTTSRMPPPISWKSQLVSDYFEQDGKKNLCSQRIVGGLHKICFLTYNIEKFYFSSICNLYRDFPSAPPGNYFNLGNNSAWVSHHQKLSTYFLKFPSTSSS